jgi:hypothetical protein
VEAGNHGCYEIKDEGQHSENSRPTAIILTISALARHTSNRPE